MTKIGKLKIFLALFTAINITLYSQTTVTAKLSDEKIGIGEVFTLSVTIDNSMGKVTIPNIDGLSLRGTSKSVNMMYSSGSLKTIQTYSYTYVATKEGIFSIDNISAKVNNVTYRANPVSIEVLKESVRNSGGDKPEGDSFDRFMNYAEEVMVNNTISKKEAYIYEPIYIEQKAYSHIPINVIGVSKIPDRTDFISYSDSFERNSFAEIIDGKRVNVMPLKREVLYAVKIGDKNILTTPFVFEKGNMFYDRIQYGEEKFEVKILPLPNNKEYENFSGAVGDFQFNVNVGKNDINIGEEVLITIEVSGEGNTSIIDMPNIDEDIKRYFSVYQPKIYETNWFEKNKMMGKKIKEYVLVATNNGNYVLPEMSFCYFSPEDKSYTNIYSRDIALVISGDREVAAIGNLALSGSKEEAGVIPIKNDIIETQNEKEFKLLNIKIIYIYVFIITAFSIIIYNSKKLKGIRFNLSGNKEMDLILENYNNDNRAEYCKSVKELLINSVNKKFNINSDIYEELKKRNIDENVINDIKEIIDSCQFELYSGNSSNGKADYHTKLAYILNEIKNWK